MLNDADPLLLTKAQNGQLGAFNQLVSRHQQLAYNVAYRAVRGPVIRRADAVITDSAFSRRDIIGRLRVRPSRIRVIPIGVPEHCRPVRDAATLRAFRKRAGISAPYILYVGNFKPHKNVPQLVRAFAGLPDRLRAGHELVLCGARDAFSQGVADEARRAGVADRVRFTGLVPDEDMAIMYSGAAVFVLPSLYEGFGLGNLEAMACGAPVISSNAASVPEVVGEAGILVDTRTAGPLTRALSAVLSDAGLRERLSARGLARAALFTPERTAGRVLSLLEEIAAPPAGTESGFRA